ncbi:MAG TPA: molybdate ABC transporter substrate-binding protein [Verrucomicrobiae bacterium]|nr:molybdate ABC transporter substrate-binding protein [Verrucomicrobiae bacterium]
MRKMLAGHLACGVLCFASAMPLRANEVRVAHATELNVYAAASLSDVLRELSVNYEKQTGDKLLFNFSASSTLERQIEEGAPADVFFSADEEKMDALERKGLLLPGTRHRLLSNALVIVAPTDAAWQLTSVFDLTNAAIAHIAIAETQSVPAGIYAKRYLSKLGLWDKLADNCVPTENVRAALAAVESGNADAGLVYQTDARIAKKVRVAYAVPVAEGPRISYPVAVVKGSKAVDAARRFVDYLRSDAALQVFRKYGFLISAEQH